MEMVEDASIVENLILAKATTMFQAAIAACFDKTAASKFSKEIDKLQR